MTEYPISLAEFKLFFMRDAGIEYQPYPDWEPETAYNEGDFVLHIVGFKPTIWKSLVNDNLVEPGTDDTMWERAEDEEEYMDDWILDRDITRAMGEAVFKFNPNLFTEEKGKMIFLYLTMFFLVYDRRMAASGLNGSSATGPVVHRTVGKMTVTYMESKLYSKYPSYEFLSSNDYGRKAFNLMLPYLRGGVRVFRGGNTGV